MLVLEAVDPNQISEVVLLLYLFTHPDVLIVQTSDINKLLEKMYCFTEKFNRMQCSNS